MNTTSSRAGARIPPSCRWLAAGTAVLALALTAVAFAAAAPAPRTIVVRGRTLSPDGRPLAGARVMARGSVSVSALTDDRGRYTLSLPLGMPGALKRLPFRMEVRAEAQGRRLPLSGGGQALVLEAAWQPASGRVRVHSNRETAATAVVTALELESVPVAWIEADFGGAPAGGADGSFDRDAALPGNTPLPPGETRPMPPEIATSAGAPAAAQPAATDTARVAMPATGAPATVTPPAPPAAAPAGADSAAAVGVARDSVAIVAPNGTAPGSVTPGPRAAPRNSARAQAPETPKIVASTRVVDAPPPRPSPVRAIDPYAPRDSVPAADSCRCSLRGTVEIDWDRPLEDHTPVRLELDAPGTKPVEVSLFMGAPREFRFGPLPCGDWRLLVHPGGKLRYTDARGDTARVVTCAGATETRIVLVPVRR